ncbi:MAG: DegT/DnrJ/EryC1/StrS family aminotransferase, partial [Actinobacteria bacterium]|nr:DegT/DnrJ/EryC1/StrS family aminotransferase [Actinomycetota bacterium]
TRKDGFEKFPSEYRRYLYFDLGSNFKPLELQAAMGRVQLKRLQEFKNKRRRNFSVLRKILESFSQSALLPFSHPKADPCWYTFPITLTNGVSRKKVLDYLDKAGIEWRPILAGNIARQPAYKNRIILRDTTPNADQLISDSFWVSVHPRHSTDTMKYVGQTIIDAIS